MSVEFITPPATVSAFGVDECPPFHNVLHSPNLRKRSFGQNQSSVVVAHIREQGIRTVMAPARAPAAMRFMRAAGRALLTAVPGQAETAFPTRTIRIVLRFAAGAISDVSLRRIAESALPRAH